VPAEVTLPVVALVLTASAICAGVIAPFSPSSTDTAPATWGLAMDVPEMVLVAVFDVIQAEVIEEPGAKRSRQDPKFEKDDRASLLVVDPTVMAAATRAGE
jgi:hypothetical protein